MSVCSIVKLLPLSTVDDLMTPKASCNSASDRPQHLGVIVLTILQTSMKWLYNIYWLAYTVVHSINPCLFLDKGQVAENLKQWLVYTVEMLLSTKIHTDSGRIWANFRRTWNLLLKFFSLLILVVHTLTLKNPSDATLASLSTLLYPRWRPRWKPIISENIVWYGKWCLKPIFFLKLYAMKLESNCRHLANNQIKSRWIIGTKWPPRWQFITKKIRK